MGSGFVKDDAWEATGINAGRVFRGGGEGWKTGEFKHLALSEKALAQ